jgi:hypothetical protein
LTSEVE